MADILGAIANPQMADIASALDYRQKKIDDDEARRKRIRTDQLAGQALSSGLQKGSALYDLASENPNAYLAVAKSMGIDPSDGSGVHQMTVDANTINKLANAGDIQGAVSYMQSEHERRKSLGLNTGYLEKGLGAIQSDPHKFFNAVDMLDKSFNPAAAEQGYTLNEGDRRYNANNELVASGAPKREASGPGDASTAHAKDLAKYQELKQTDPAMAEQFGQMVGLVSREGRELSAGVTKMIDDLTEENRVANYNVTRYSTLAKKIRDADYTAGAAGKGSEAVKSIFGNEDEVTALKKELALIRNSEALKSLPAGTASEKDVAMVMEPMPNANSNPQYVAKWLDAYAKVSDGAAKYSDAKIGFLVDNGSVRSKNGKSFVDVWKDSQKESASSTPPAEANSGGWSIKPVGQ